MNDRPQFSIITVCWNEKDRIRTTCESVCGQTMGDFEWIVIDGESTDGTLAILNEYEERMAVFVSENDAGIYDAMNKGIDRATGKYLVFMNGGDQFSDERVLQNVSEAPQEDLVFGDVTLEEKDGTSTIKSFPELLPRDFLQKNMMPHQSSYFRRELFEKHGNYNTDYTIAADYDLFVRMLFVNKVSSAHLSMPLSVFRMDGISCSATRRQLRKKENHTIRMKYFLRYRFSLKALRQVIRNHRDVLLKKSA